MCDPRVWVLNMGNLISTGPRVVLIGAMGAGKTTVGQILAERWDVGFRDTDADIEATAGKTVSDIFVEDGEATFRALERTAVAAALADHDGVLSLGGGAVMDESIRSLLGAHRVVFLSVGLADAASRVGLGVSRPMLLGNVRGQMKKLLDERAPVYQSVATATVATDGLSPDEVADAVASVMEQPHG